MKKITITMEDIKTIKNLMNVVDSLKDKSLVFGDYSVSYGKQADIIGQKEKSIEKNISIAAKLLKVDYNTVVDMCYDFEFAKMVLADHKI